MPPTRKTKRANGLSQPTLSFSQRHPHSNPGSSKLKSSTPLTSTPTSSLEAVREDAPALVPPSAAAKEVKSKATDTRPLTRSRKQLDVKSKEWDGVWKDAKAAMGGMKPIHASPETHNNVHHILRVFDMTAKYGPSVGITRLQRWERAKKWGLNPPQEIHSILTTAEGEDDPAYRENVLYGWV